jgi:hypothetical protein
MSVSVASQTLTGQPTGTRWSLGRKTRIAAAIAAVVVVALAVGVVTGGARWTRETSDATARPTTPAAAPARAVAFADLEGLPAPVQRYLRMALRDGQPQVASVRLQQSGRLRTGVESAQWLDFEAAETIAPEARGFVWDARIRLAPFLHAALRDTYIGGTASGAVALQSAFTLSSAQGGRELNAGDLYRLLAEAPWAPTLLLPREGLSWARINDRRALVSLTQGGETATMEFRFNDAGEIAAVFAAARPRMYGTTYVSTPWEGHFNRYVTVGGMRVPQAGEVGWWVEDRWIPVWQGTVTRFDVDFAGR